jgi:pimeloyl-ACP methyl ester carboxylesterase
VTFTKVVIGGHSGGSILAIGAASTYPEDVDGVLITGFIHNVNTEARVPQLIDRLVHGNVG